MTVPKRTLLLLTQAIEPVVALSTCTRLVLAIAVDDTEASEHDDADLCHQIDRVADGISGSVFKEVCPSVR